MIAVGTAVLVGIPAVLATLHAADTQFRWWWPTNWMAIPSVIFLAGCLLVAVPVRRSPDQSAVSAASLTRPAVPLPGDDRAGEHSALMVTGTSPAVTALETVLALVMGTEDFAAFISAHPQVLDTVENQVYGRPAQLQSAPGPGRRYRPTGENCTVVRTDVVAFGAEERDDQARRIIRQASSYMTRQALGRPGTPAAGRTAATAC